MNLYFGTVSAVLSTLLFIAILAYFVFTAARQAQMTHWGRRTGLLAAMGLVLCCFVVVRDGYVNSVTALFDPAVAPGLLAADGFIATLCYAGGAAVAIVLLFCLLARKQHLRKGAFFALGGVILLKTLLVEIGRWVVQ